MANSDNGLKANSLGAPAATVSLLAGKAVAKSDPRKVAAKSAPRKAAVKSAPRKAAAKSRPTKGAAITPTLTKKVVDPDSGPAAGNTAVKIHGKNLVAVQSVTFGVNFALYFNEINAGLLEAASPPGAAGTTVDIVVATRIDPPLTLPAAFTYT